jgi:putative PEP-CTERM system TPR-repeat lipoprotein
MPHQVNKRLLSTAVVSGALLLGAGISACSRTETAASLIAEAQQYQQKGDDKAALIQLKNAVANNPEHGEARLALASLYNTVGDPVSAEKEIRKAMGLGIGAERSAPVLAKALLAQGQFQKVLDEIGAPQAAKSAPLLTARGDAHAALGQNAPAKLAYEQALALAPNDGNVLISLTRFSFAHNDAEAGKRYAADAVAKDPKNAEVWMLKGAMLRSENKAEEAIAAFSQAIMLNPAHRGAHVEKATAEIGLGKFDAAKTDLEAARKITPGSLVVSYTQALLDFSQGKNAAALESMQKVLRVAPEHMPSLLLSGAIELALGSTQQAEQHLQHYLATYPNNLYARKLLAQTLLKNSHPGDAAAALAPALNDQAQDPQLLALAGQSYMQTRDFTKAAGYFERASALAPKASMLHTSLGLSKLGQGDAVKAVSELELATALDPKSMEAGMALVQTELSLKHFDKALAAVLTLEKQQPDNPQVHNLKGVVYLSQGERAKARASFEKAVAQADTFFPAVVNLARMDMQDKQPQAAKQRFERVLAKDKKHIDAMTAMAALSMAAGNTPEATGWMEKASTENPDALAPALKLATLYLRTKQAPKALTLARKFQATNPTNPELLDLLGQASVANNDPAAALEAYSKLVNVMPKSAMAQVRLASVHAMMKNDAAAEDDLKRAIALDPKMLEARLVQVDLAMRNKKSDDALVIARAIQKLDGKLGIGLLIESDILLAQNKPAPALAAMEKAFVTLKSPQVLIKIATTMKQQGRAKEMTARLLAWHKDHPDEPMVGMYLAESDLTDKQYKAAIGRFEALLKNHPGNVLMLNNLAWAYQQEKDPRAVETAEQAVKLAPDSSAVLDTLGWILVEQGNTARGLPLLQKAVTLTPAASDIRFHLATGLAKSGDKANARKELDKLLSDNKTFPQIEDARLLLKSL